MAKKTNNNKTEGNIASVVVQNIEIKSFKRITQDIQTWRDAIKAAENVDNPNRIKLYDLYNDLLVDSHLRSVIEKRYTSITKTPIIFAKDNKEDEEITNIINSDGFRNLLKDLLDSKFWGHTLLEIISIVYDEFSEKFVINYELIPRKHVVPEKGWIKKAETDTNALFEYRNPPLSDYVIEAGKKSDLGMFMSIAQYVIYKRGAFGDWAEYAEMFGKPFREARYENFDEKTRFQLEQMLENYGSAMYAILPKEAEFKLHQATAAASSNVLYQSLVEACNAEISKAIVGQTMTTEEGSSLSQAQVHQDTEDSINKDDRNFIIDILDTKFKPILKKLGFNVAGGYFKYEEEDRQSAEEKIKIWKEVVKNVPIADDDWYYTFNVPKPENYDQLKREQMERAAALQKQPTPDDPKKKGNNPDPEPNPEPKNSLSRWERFLRLFNVMRRLRPFDIAPGRGHIQYGYLNASSNDPYELSADDLELLKKFKDMKTYDPVSYQKNIDKLADAIRKGFDKKYDYGTEHNNTLTWMEVNVNRFGYDKNVAQITELNKAFRETDNFNDFKKKAEGILGNYNRHYLSTEYTTALSASQNADRWLTQKAQKNIFPYLRYDTAGDDKVRLEHMALDGKVFMIDRYKDWQDIYPPNGWRCRCEMVQLRSDEVKPGDVTSGDQAKELLGKEWDKMQEDGFAGNRGEMKTVFDLDKAYINKLKSKPKPINKLTYIDANRPAFKKLNKNLPVVVTKSADPDKLLADFDKKKKQHNKSEIVIYTDYAKRIIAQDRKIFKEHISKPGRAEIFHYVKDILVNPDEVYMTMKTDEIANYRFIKFFKDEIIVVNLNVLKNGGIELKTWYKTDRVDMEREGILIKNAL